MEVSVDKFGWHFQGQQTFGMEKLTRSLASQLRASWE